MVPGSQSSASLFALTLSPSASAAGSSLSSHGLFPADTSFCVGTSDGTATATPSADAPVGTTPSSGAGAVVAAAAPALDIESPPLN